MLNILSPVGKITKNDFPVSDTTVLNPLAANAFQQGDWYEFDPNVTGNQHIVIAGAAPTFAFPVWSKRGEGSTQFGQLLAVIYLGHFMADTDRFDATVTYAEGEALYAANGVLSNVVAGAIQGHVVIPPDKNNNLLRFVNR